MEKEIPVRLSVHNLPDTSGSVKGSFLDRPQRLKRAFKYWGAIWGAGVGCVFIPIMHFVLVPTAIILGPVMFYHKLNESDLVLDGTGVCPKCKGFLSVPAQNLDWPLQQNCTECGTLVVIEPV